MNGKGLEVVRDIKIICLKEQYRKGPFCELSSSSHDPTNKKLVGVVMVVVISGGGSTEV